jgi:hypothetical protein
MPHRKPPNRQLRAYAFDPLLSTKLGMRGVNEIVVSVPWEDALAPGPVGEYLEVIDVDPASGLAYPPVDLNHPYLLAVAGLAPAEGSYHFHQQMVYAVAMTTIRNFERALGRKAFWRWRVYRDEDKGTWSDAFVQRLRIYPHAVRDANAYYSPDKVALLFGYFPASTTAPGANLPGGTVFTCLSHDIVAHETAHALLDGLHRRMVEPSNPDALAFHEAFSDIVALFQHFTYPEALRGELVRTRGSLDAENNLAMLAHQFGQATGYRQALREYVGTEPDPGAYASERQPHARGAILVAAVFDAFLTIYRHRTADLFRIARHSESSAEGIHPDVVERLAGEASRTAQHVLTICIRALDYCPAVDVHFGDYLRALITADADLVPDDDKHYRLAFVEAFRRRGIYPRDVRSLSEESLVWRAPDEDTAPAFGFFAEAGRELLDGTLLVDIRDEFGKRKAAWPRWRLDASRRDIYKSMCESQKLFHSWLLAHYRKDPERAEPALRAAGLTLSTEAPRSLTFSRGRPALEVHSVRPARRTGPDGHQFTDYVVVVTQRRKGYFDRKVQAAVDAGRGEAPRPDFWFRGGCTLLVEYSTGTVRYCIGKDILSDWRLERQRRYLLAPAEHQPAITYFGDPRFDDVEERLAGLHQLSGGG